MQPTPSSHEQPPERRSFRRIHTILSGRLTSGERVSNGVVLDLSVSGARVHMAEPSPLGDTVTMHIARLGEFKGKVMWRASNMLGLRFADHPIQVSQLMAGLMPQECLAH